MRIRYVARRSREGYGGDQGGERSGGGGDQGGEGHQGGEGGADQASHEKGKNDHHRESLLFIPLLLSRYTLLSDLLSRSALLRIPRTNFFTLLQIRDAAASRLCLKLADSDMLLCSISISMPYAKHARSYQSVLLKLLRASDDCGAPG